MEKRKNIKRINKKELEAQEKSAIRKLTRRIKIMGIVSSFLLVALVGRLFWIEVVHGAEYKRIAYNQQTANRIISPKRGTIFDSTGKALAMSSRVDTVTINPGKIVNSKDKRIDSEVIAKGLSEIFSLDFEETLAKVNSESSVETIIKKVEQDKITLLKNWMKTEEISAGINIDEDNKRSYPYESFAANLIGFCGTDNQGLDGLEYTWDAVLQGTPGKIVTSSNAGGQEIPDENRRTISAENGSDIILTIDYNIQSVAEKYLKQAVNENNCKRGGNVLIMNPENGDILAMATYPDYNLNTPMLPNQTLLNKGYENLDTDGKNAAIREMWRNTASSATYEPGSVFKILTTAIALEENLVDPDASGQFSCNIVYDVAGTEISCWRTYQAHGYQSLRQALCNSCNPAFMQLGQKIGGATFCRYLRAFGLYFSSTGSGIYGEQISLVHEENNLRSSGTCYFIVWAKV